MTTLIERTNARFTQIMDETFGISDEQMEGIFRQFHNEILLELGAEDHRVKLYNDTNPKFPTEIIMTAQSIEFHYFDENTELHRENEPAYLHYNKTMGLDETRYMHHGKFYKLSNDMPAYRMYQLFEFYNDEGKLHRDNNKPAIVSPTHLAFYVDGKRTREIWM